MKFGTSISAALALLSAGAAADGCDSPCREKGFPIEGVWNVDKDCCAGTGPPSTQMACADGYRLEPIDEDDLCYDDGYTKAYNYKCTQCEEGDDSCQGNLGSDEVASCVACDFCLQGLAEGAAESVVVSGPEGKNCGDLVAAADASCMSIVMAEAICCPSDDDEGKMWHDWSTCTVQKCNAMSVVYPEGWGVSRATDLAFIRGDAAIAAAVDCSCKNCAELEALKVWPSNADGAACAVARGDEPEGGIEADPEDFTTCSAVKCNTLSVTWPQGWGTSKEADVASIRGDAAIAAAVGCTCKNCADFDEMKMWPANADGTACAVAEEEVGGEGSDESEGGDEVNPEDFTTCSAVKCNTLSVAWPQGWGTSKEADMASIRGDAAIAAAVGCTCKNCADFDEMKMWPANADGTACAVAEEEVGGEGSDESEGGDEVNPEDHVNATAAGDEDGDRGDAADAEVAPASETDNGVMAIEWRGAAVSAVTAAMAVLLA